MTVADIIRKFSPPGRRIAPWLILLTTAACGGSGGPSPSSADASTGIAATCRAASLDCGLLLVSLTDADGELISYVVDVVALTIFRSDGLAVDVLQNPTRLDLADRIELAELISAASVPPGEYVGGSAVIDYSNAEILVQSGGEAVAAMVLDRAGIELERVELTFDLATDQRLIVRRGATSHLGLDFDLGYSHAVDADVSPAVVTADPVLLAEVVPVRPKALRVHGRLLTVDIAAGVIEVELHPWHDTVDDHGHLTIHTTADTLFEADSVIAMGAAGLTNLTVLESGAAISATGKLNLLEMTFTADVVLAGSSVGGTHADAVHGNVVSRNGDLLTVKGALLLQRNAHARVFRTVQVLLGPNTRVAALPGHDNPLATDAVSVGQRVAAFGQLNAYPADGTVPLLDVTDGRVRIQTTTLSGSIVSMVPGQIDLRLRAIDHLAADMFDFSGTGVDTSSDSNPDNYAVATPLQAPDGVGVGRAVRVAGFASPFGSAPPDFVGRVVAGQADIPSTLTINWLRPGTSAPFARMDPDGVVIDLSNAEIGDRHQLSVGFRQIDLFELPGSPTLSPQYERGRYAITTPGHVALFGDFAIFIEHLNRSLNDSAAIRAFAAFGRYEPTQNRLETLGAEAFVNAPGNDGLAAQP